MAGAFKETVLTSKGIALLAKAQASKCKISFTRAVSGNGSYSSGEVIKTRTALKSQKQSFKINKLLVQNESTAVVRFIVANLTDSGTLTEGYYVTEVGVYATDPDVGEILYGIAIAEDDKADYLPAYNNVYPSTVTVNFEIEVAHASTVNIVGGAGGYVSEVDFDALEDEVEGDDAPFAGLKDTSEAVALLANRVHQLIDAGDDEAEAREALETELKTEHAVETGTVTLTNSQSYPFNNSIKAVTLAKTRKNAYYTVETQVTAYSGGLPGSVTVSDKATNGFKVAFDGSAKSVTVKYIVKGGYLS